MCGGGGDTTEVTNTGLGDQQQEAIIGNQAAIQSSVDGVGTSVNEGFAQQQNNFDAQGNAIDDVSSDIQTQAATNAVNIMNQSQNQYEATTADISGLNTNVNNQAATTNTAIGDLSNTVDTRADELTGTINTSTGELSNQIDTRLDTTDQSINDGFSLTNANLGTVYDGLGTQAEEGFAGVATDVADSRTALSDQLTTTSQNVLGATSDINALVDKYGNEQNLQFGSLSQGQTDLMSNQGTLQTAFDDYTKQYSGDVQLANQSRADMGNSVIGGFTELSNQLGTGITGTQGAIDSVAQGVGNINQGVDTGFATVTSNINDGVDSTTGAIDAVGQSVNTGFGAVALDIASGVAVTTAEGQAQRQDFVTNIESMRAYLSDQTLQLEDSVRGDYTSLVSSFDAQGVLISNSVDENGNSLSRAIDENGNLFIQTSNEQGQVLDQQALNIDAMMGDFAAFGQEQSSGNAAVQESFKNQGDLFDDSLDTKVDLISDSITANGAALQQELAAESASIQASFDTQGNLISDSVDANGNTLQRQIDEQGNLILSTYSQSTGLLIDRQALDAAQLMRELYGPSLVQGTNATSGYASPPVGSLPSPALYSGFSSPYATSF